MLRKLFTAHPASVGESYLEHMGQALGFATRMLAGSLACFVHALFPFLCVKTGSKCITELHDRMVANRDRRAAARRHGAAEAREPAVLADARASGRVVT
jgi:hypothetical protein